jgi:uroporphyrinogen decarboxylase
LTAREHFRAITKKESKTCGFWQGLPHQDSEEKIFSYFGVKDTFELGLKLGSGCRFVQPEACGMWQRKDYPQFDPFNVKQYGQRERTSLGQEGVFADCYDLAEIHGYHWPTAADCDFTLTLEEIDKTVAEGQAVLSGTWGSIFSNTWNFFGMENCLIRMVEAPETVLAVTSHLAEFYLEANEKLFALAGNKIDALFIGNDFGSQLDLIISPEYIETFFFPFIKKFIDQAHQHGYFFVLHSCGSIYRLIPRLIELGVDVLHPIQAMAAHMDADSLSQYQDRIVFLGGVDTQRILPFGTPDEVRREVRRLKKIFGPHYIVSPSHEMILPNIPPENIAAMAEAALE